MPQVATIRHDNWVLYLCLSAASQVSLIWPNTFRNHLFCVFNYHLPSFFVIISTLHSLNLSLSFWPLDPCPITLLTSWLQWVTSNLRQNCKPVKSLFSISFLFPSFFLHDILSSLMTYPLDLNSLLQELSFPSQLRKFWGVDSKSQLFKFLWHTTCNKWTMHLAKMYLLFHYKKGPAKQINNSLVNNENL